MNDKTMLYAALILLFISICSLYNHHKQSTKRKLNIKHK